MKHVDIMANTAYLEIILGPMYASKTTRLVEIYKKCLFCDIPVTVINHSCDTRYDTTLMTTHDNIQVPCIMVDKLMDVYFDPDMACIDLESDVLIPGMKEAFRIQRSDVILINEGQFFPDLEEFVKRMLSHNKRIYVCGLDGDFERKKFGQILDLIPLCDKVTKLTSLCHLCKNGTPGIFSKRLSLETEQTVVGSDNYISVCRNCFEK
jgi:thymidine kinase